MAPPLPFRLVLVTDWGTERLLDKVEAALAGARGIAVQHRHPEATDRQFFEEGRALAEVCHRHRAPLFVNRRLDVALALDAHLHLPASGVRASDVRPFLGDRWVSVAVHGEGEAQPGASLALVSPVFAPHSKPGDRRPPLGPEGFFRLARSLGCPAFALGGVDERSAATLAGADGLAAISAILTASDPAQAARRMIEALEPR